MLEFSRKCVILPLVKHAVVLCETRTSGEAKVVSCDQADFVKRLSVLKLYGL